mmetsp:Transcript_3588/g.6800  ORF Transcript_3588/g.6800 Transcript_3588/m.6800 type:complete len:87 (-) Transcript_3588:256-516(-)
MTPSCVLLQWKRNPKAPRPPSQCIFENARMDTTRGTKTNLSSHSGVLLEAPLHESSWHYRDFWYPKLQVTDTPKESLCNALIMKSI